MGLAEARTLTSAQRAAQAQAQPLVLAEDRLLPVAQPVAGLLPGGGLRRGSTVIVAGSLSLALSLAAGPSAAGSWVGAVGLPDLGIVAGAEAGIALERFALVPAPGDQWASVVAALVDTFDVVLAGLPTSGARPADARRLTARARERGSVLVPVLSAGGQWPDGADVRLEVERRRYDGLGFGDGHLAAVHLHVDVSGRGAAARPRRGELVLGTGAT